MTTQPISSIPRSNKSPYNTKWFAQGSKCKRGFNTRLQVREDVNCVIGANESFTGFVNKHLVRYGELLLKPVFCS